jgi:uncharacterized protein YxjI
MKHCVECGTEIKIEGQRYCEQCGAELFTEEPKIETPKTTTPRVPHQEGGLFDLSRTYYLIHERAWDMGFGEIYDEKGTQIGRMNRIIFSIRRRVELQEMDGTVAATIHSKIISARGAQDLKDPEGNHIARIKRKILTFFKQKFFLEEPVTKTRWYEAEGDFFGWSFKIYSVPDRKLVAEIEKADRWRDVFLGGIFDFADKYALRIHENETDRRILLGFVLSIDNVLHDSSGGMGPMMGMGHMRTRSGRIPGRPGSFGRTGRGSRF